MGVGVVKALAVGLVALFLGALPFLFVMLMTENPAPPTTTFKPWWWEPINISDHYKEISPREYVILKPLTWHQATIAVWEGKGSFEYAFAAYEPDKQLLFDYVWHARGSCQRLRKLYSSYLNMPYPTKYTTYLKDNCSFLKLVYFSNTPSWYPSLNLIGYFKKLYFKQVHPKRYWLFILVFNASDGMHVKFYNVLNPNDLNELINDIKFLKAIHSTLLIKMFHSRYLWYDRYLQIVESKIPFLLIYIDDVNTHNFSAIWPRTLKKVFSAIDPRIKNLDLMEDLIDDTEMILKNGKIITVYGAYCEWFHQFFEKSNIACLPQDAPLPKHP